MLKDVFDSIRRLLCYKIFKDCKEYVLKHHFVGYHFNINNLNNKGMEEVLIDKKKIIFFRKIKMSVEYIHGNFIFYF